MKKLNLFSQYRGLRKELYILFIGRMMTNMGAMIWPIFSLILSQKLGMNAFEIAIYTSVVTILGIPVNLLGGKLADKINKRLIIIVCDLVSVSSFIYCFFAPLNFYTISVFVLASLFQNVEGPSFDALVADFTISKDRERAYSLSYLGNNLGLVLSPTIAGFLFNDYLNIAFLINGLSILFSTILIIIFIKDMSLEKDDSIESTYEEALNSKESSIKFIFKNKVLTTFICMTMISSFVYSMWTYLIPYDLSFFYNEKAAALQGTMTSLNCILVVLFTGLITRWFVRIKDVDKMKVGESLILLGYLVFVLLTKYPIFCYVAIFLFTMGEIFNTLSSSPFLTKRIPSSHRGRIISIQGVCCSVFSAIMQVVVGWLRNIEGNGQLIAWMFVIGMGVLNFGAIFALKWLDKKKYPLFYN